MQQFYADYATAEDRQAARRIYLRMAACYASLILLLGVLVAMHVPTRDIDVVLAESGGSRAGVLFSAEAAEMPDRAQCAASDLKLLTSLNEHGEAQDVPADDLRYAFFALVKARKACAEGRVAEGLALYDNVTIGSSKTAQKQ